MDVILPYGRATLSVRLPPGCEPTMIRKRPHPPLPDPGAAVAAALRSPIDSAPLGEAARGCRSACVLICDVTRPVPNGLLLPRIVDTLVAAGLAPDDITVLVATGLHRPNEGAELAALVGDRRVLDTVRVGNHFAHRLEDHVSLGTTPIGTPILLDRRFVEADLRLVTGLVEPHFMAGYSGGRKLIVPGISHARTIARFHAADLLDHPRATNCQLQGNPIHAEQLEIVSRLGPVLALNVVLDEQRRLCGVTFGELQQSHLAAVQDVRRHAEVAVDHRFRTVLTSAAGSPLDATYYQTVKALVAPLGCLAPRSRLFVASGCDQGVGSEPYREAQARLVDNGPDAFLRGIRARRCARPDEWQTQMQLRATDVTDVHLFTDGLSAEERRLTGLQRVADPGALEAALAEWMAHTGDPRIAVIPEGPYVIPRPASAR